jgi:uncharacterized protein YndB with AHSA1/START domain
MPDILHLVRMAVSPAQVYQALTTSEGIRNWWTRNADIGSEIGQSGEFRFSSYGDLRITQVVIEELIPALRVQWKVTASFMPQWLDTTIAFELRPDPAGMMLALAHRGFPQSDDIYALCNTGWAYYLVSLQQYLEKGQGAPSPDVDFARMLA